MKSSIQQPTKLEQVAASTMQGLRLLAEEYSWDFDKAISDIEFLVDAHEHPVTPEEALAGMREYAEASGREVRQLVELNKDDEALYDTERAGALAEAGLV